MAASSPHDVWLHIFDRCAAPALLALRQTCTRFRHLIAANELSLSRSALPRSLAFPHLTLAAFPHHYRLRSLLRLRAIEQAAFKLALYVQPPPEKSSKDSGKLEMERFIAGVFGLWSFTASCADLAPADHRLLQKRVLRPFSTRQLKYIGTVHEALTKRLYQTLEANKHFVQDGFRAMDARRRVWLFSLFQRGPEFIVTVLERHPLALKQAKSEANIILFEDEDSLDVGFLVTAMSMELKERGHRCFHVITDDDLPGRIVPCFCPQDGPYSPYMNFGSLMN
ncbi:hypothetical protein NEOLI_001244 [Neolecta irregularis DAH-3]|uniref:F-box domain-containing protein n=1 Tax=Neolecta irregularis (strain DAH-3) TaxID=1198029 RepID=A0A1U7LKC2_NEOID|nr:hypothetical protein NEOLI_001244 [Neolecta irregularis DAH-3]|eukprot:OLL23097.1 hypothetical protein NEOLI_001244 [Neolecta irregularis DAH-3]